MNIGQKIKERRVLLQLTQEELANRCELTKGYISQLENDKVSPSIETLELILEVLGTNFSDFFYEAQKEPVVFPLKMQYSKKFLGYKQTWLIPTAQEHLIEPILIELEPESETIWDNPHEGEEFGYVLEGEIGVVYGESSFVCHQGESFYFVTNRQHYLRNHSEKTAKVLWVSTPPNF